MNPKVPALAVGGVVLLAALAGCSSKDKGENSIAITATDSACDVATTDLPSGTTTFAVTNKGSDVTEVYVYGEGDKVMGEVENIGPGTSRDFTVDLGAGSYEVACKPGQKGDGIRTAITVSGSATTLAAADRTVTFQAFDHGYTGLDGLTVTQGDTIEFAMTNTATDTQHEFEVLGADGNPLGEIGPTDPGATGTVVLTFDKAGSYTFVCGITDHEAMGMKGEFTVTPV
jgi:plastocyanin